MTRGQTLRRAHAAHALSNLFAATKRQMEGKKQNLKIVSYTRSSSW